MNDIMKNMDTYSDITSDLNTEAVKRNSSNTKIFNSKVIFAQSGNKRTLSCQT